MSTFIPVASLVVAILAVFIGPYINLVIADRRIKANLLVANRQAIAPMRQAWINRLRELLSELLSLTLHYRVSGYEDRKDEEYQRLTLLEHQVSLMLNPYEDDHERLLGVVRNLVGMLGEASRDDDAFAEAHQELVRLSKEILKREWNRVKEEKSV